MEENYLPLTLYKYQDRFDYLDDFLLNKTVFYSSPNNFTDQFDCKVYLTDNFVHNHILELNKSISKELNFDKRNELINDYRYLKSLELDVNKFLTEAINHRNRERVVIYCLTTKSNSEYHWIHYGNNHKGYNIEFISRLITPENYIPFKILPVKYFLEHDQTCEVNDVFEYLESFTTKQKIYQPEYEYRIVLFFKESKIEKGMKIPIQIDAIKSITFGKYVPDSKIEEYRWKIINQGLFNVEVKKEKY